LLRVPRLLTPYWQMKEKKQEDLSNRLKILVIDDDEDILDLIGLHLERAGYQMIAAAFGKEGIKLASDQKPDAIVLDVMIPGLDGFEVAKKLKSSKSTKDIPIIFLSAKVELENRLKGFEAGADDYLPKPFSPKELIMRLKVMLRHKQIPVPEDVLTVGPLVMKPKQLRFMLEDTPLDLPPLEYKLLSLLMNNVGIIFSREDLLREVWDNASGFDDRTVDTYIYRVREKLGKHSTLLETVRGQGYRMVVPSSLDSQS